MQVGFVCHFTCSSIADVFCLQSQTQYLAVLLPSYLHQLRYLAFASSRTIISLAGIGLFFLQHSALGSATCWCPIFLLIYSTVSLESVKAHGDYWTRLPLCYQHLVSVHDPFVSAHSVKLITLCSPRVGCGCCDLEPDLTTRGCSC